VTKKQWFVRGMRAGIPISLGYFAVSLALGLSARNAGFSPKQGAESRVTYYRSRRKPYVRGLKGNGMPSQFGFGKA
jgi:hypothetical protein